MPHKEVPRIVGMMTLDPYCLLTLHSHLFHCGTYQPDQSTCHY